MRNIFAELKEADLTDYAPIPFWSWNNHMDRAELLRQIDEMKSIGCGGFVLHARTGLKTEYLSEEWFALVGACLDRAQELGMNVWIYDENGWPSGFVGGKLLENEENLAPYLEYEKVDTYDRSAFAVFEVAGGHRRRLREGEKSADGVYHAIYVRRSPANTDILNPRVVEQFIEMTHEEYYRRFSDRFGKTFVGFFTDEPQYYRWGTPFSYSCAEFWQKEYGEDIRDRIIDLYFDDESSFDFRVRYYAAMNTLYTQNFYKRIYDWCEEHGCKLTGHSVEEGNFQLQMLGGAGCTPSYEYEHIPGIDNLAKYSSAKLSARQVGSAAGQLGKKQVLTESFGCCGYDAVPRQLLAIAEKQYVHGVNLMCHHLFAYSLAGQGKTDHPPVFSRQSPWFSYLRDFNLYLTRLGWLLANSQPAVNCAVINPMRSVYLHYYRFQEDKARETDEQFTELQAELNELGILYDMVDESILKGHGALDGKDLAVGLRKYSYIIVPACETLSVSTKETLARYISAGGKVYVVSAPAYTDGIADDWSFLRSNVSLREIAATGSISVESGGKCEYTYRVGEGFSFLYIVNVEKESAKVKIPEGFSRVDLLRFSLQAQEPCFELKAGEGAVFMPLRGEPGVRYGGAKDITGLFRFSGASDNNLTLDTVRLSKDGEKFGEEEPIAEAFDRLLRERYCGRLSVKFTFNVKQKGTRMVLRREKGDYRGSALNGQPLQFHSTPFDVLFEEADILSFVQTGKNEYVYETEFYERPHVHWALFSPSATESVRNCLYYDSELESVYLSGDFSVDEDRAVAACAAPGSVKDIQAQGYPFFAGRMKFTAEIEGKCARAQLRACGAYAAIAVKVNGESAGSLNLAEHLDIALKQGEKNFLELEVCSTLRNMFGPFHFAQDEDVGVSPFCFTLRGSWENGKSDFYTPEYKLKPFGVDKIEISFEK